MFLVIQMHYKNKFQSGQVDNSGVTLELTSEKSANFLFGHKKYTLFLALNFPRLKYQVAHYVLGNYGYIPALRPEFNLESACVFDKPFEIHPIAFRAHTHELGVISVGYHIQNSTWNLIGQISPQEPQVNLNLSDLIKNNMPI
jgi:peptidylglycine monooxygenase